MDYLHGPSITTRVLMRGRQEGQSDRVGEGAVTLEAEVRVMPLLEREWPQRMGAASGSW